MPSNPPGKQYIIEFIQIGQQLKVTAIDPVTMREVSMIGDPQASRQHMERLAVRKLEYVLRKEGA